MGIMVRGYNFSCQGFSHKATNKPCQDYSLCRIESGSHSVIIVCDGHGGERYFRSGIGAKTAAQVTLDAVDKFVRCTDKSLFNGVLYTARPAAADKNNDRPFNAIDNAFRQLFSSIICQWNNQTEAHAAANPLTDWEKANVKQEYKDAFLAKKDLEKIYGCTLIAYVQSETYWFAFQIGDGKCISFMQDIVYTEPVPWDDKCFLNKTTSLCDNAALEEIRYCFDGSKTFPVAVFLGSDGVDDSFGTTENLVNFYIQVLKMLDSEGFDATTQSLQKDLPVLSSIGSKDDMSVAFIYDENRLKDRITQLIQYQISLVQDGMQQLNKRIYTLKAKILNLENPNPQDRKTKIELDYAKQDIASAEQQKENLQTKLNILYQQLPCNRTSPKENTAHE
ncbi:MAG: protein phosphatase 2C domain-containing protein [Bacteroidales bacterium]|nr:protein phosphatase 2C domain-containing protein [Bacteroidales bacterium]MBP3254757.1 protein phosphatase 2C domain-containing protein [Bacteroidales bacterium]